MNTLRSGLWVMLLSVFGYSVAGEIQMVDKERDVDSVILLPPSDHEPPPKLKE